MKDKLYDMIFKRKSVRKYKLEPLDSSTLREVEEFGNSAQPLYDDIKIGIRIVSQGEASGFLSIKAPHYMIMTSEKKDGYLTNAGYIFQQVDLFLSSKGIGGCYLGLTQPKSEIKKELENEVVMVLAFGNPAEAVHRTDVSEFKRKALKEITNSSGYDRILEAARLAPSATNSQPWFFTGENGKLKVYCIKPNLLKALIYGRLNKFDMGIALYHITVASEKFGLKAEFVKEASTENNPPKGYYYIGTLFVI